MRMTIKLPRVAETASEVVIAEWLVAVSDTVREGQAILKVETDKATVEVPTPVSGMIVELLVSPDDEVATGEPIAVIEAV